MVTLSIILSQGVYFQEKKKPRRDDIENEDDQDTFFEVLAKRKAEGGEEEIVDYDENGYPIMKKKESLEEPIPPKDHSKVLGYYLL